MLPWVGLVVLMLIEVAYAPQLVRIAQRRSAGDLSILASVLNVLGRLVALLYCIDSGAMLFAAALIVGISLRATVMLQIAAYRRVAATDAPPAVLALPYQP